MSTHFIFSATGSPGCTTTVVGLAHVWPRPVIVVEADISRPSSIIPGYIRGELEHTRGIGQLVDKTRGRSVGIEDIWNELVPLATSPASVSPDHSKFFLPGPLNAEAARGMTGLWSDLAIVLAQLEDTGTDVLVDAGRFHAGDPRTPLYTASDAPVVVVRPNLPDITALAAALKKTDGGRGLLDLLTNVGHERYLAAISVTGPVGNYSATFAKKLSLGLVGRLPWEPEAAAAFSLGEKAGRKSLEKTKLVGAYRAVSETLTATIAGRNAELGIRPLQVEEVEAQ